MISYAHKKTWSILRWMKISWNFEPITGVSRQEYARNLISKNGWRNNKPQIMHRQDWTTSLRPAKNWRTNWQLRKDDPHPIKLTWALPNHLRSSRMRIIWWRQSINYIEVTWQAFGGICRNIQIIKIKKVKIRWKDLDIKSQYKCSCKTCGKYGHK